MNLLNINFLSFTGRKFLLKTGCWLVLISSMFFPRLQAKPIIPLSAGHSNYQMQSNVEAFLHEWLYNYCEKPTLPEIEMVTAKLMKMLVTFQRRKVRYSTEEQWLENIFYQVHRKYLKHYKIFSAVPDLFERGTYDCVSGTALYALICELLYIPYAIRETEYHVYLLALVDGKKVLIESTDPLYGFVTHPDTVQSLIRTYQEYGSSKHAMHRFTNSTVDWTQLAGLQYFNKAVQFYNSKNFPEALSFLNKAMEYYKSARITSFKQSILKYPGAYLEIQTLKKQ